MLNCNVFSIDGTRSTGCGRMVNDSRKPNCKVVAEEKNDGNVKLAMYAIQYIKEGSELRFDYNDQSVFWHGVS